MSDWLGALIGAAERGLYTAFKPKNPKNNEILKVVNWAKQAGIHPIYALGGGFNSGYTSTPMTWGDGSMGEGIGDALSGLYDEIQTGQENRKKDFRRIVDDQIQAGHDGETKRYNDASIDLIKAQTATENARLAELLRGGTRGGNPSVPGQPILTDPWGNTYQFSGSLSQEVQNAGGEAAENADSFSKLLKLFQDKYPWTKSVYDPSGKAPKNIFDLPEGMNPGTGPWRPYK